MAGNTSRDITLREVQKYI